MNLGLKFDFFGLFVVHEPFADSCSALTILEQDEADLNHGRITIFGLKGLIVLKVNFKFYFEFIKIHLSFSWF
jgi:hypothetical protein